MSSDQQQRIMGYFIEEAKDHLNTIEQGLLNLQGTIEDPDMISEVFRAAHSIKGGAAMLGIDSIQQMAHRLEDCFKSLKEQPVQVDQRLETLFLEVFDALKALIDQLQSPFGLTEKSAAKIVNTATPVLGELQQHLNQMLQSGVPTTRAAAGSKASASHDAERLPLSQPLLEAFRTEVPAQLRQMLQLFKQDDTASGRAQLDDCCQLLLLPGESVDLPAAWDRLVDQVRSAIAYPDNSYRQLAPVVITNLKQAQEQVLAAQGHAITPSSALDALTPSQPGSSLDDLLADFSDPFDAAAEEVALPAETDALAAEAALEGSDDADLLTDLGTFAQDTEETDDELADLFELDAPAAESASQPQAEQARLDLVSALSDTADSDLDSLFGDLMDEDANLDGGEHELSAVELPVPGQDEPSQTELGQTELGQAEPSQVEPQQDSSDGLQEALPAELRDTGLDDLDDDLGDLFSQAEDGLASTEPPALFSSPGEPGTPSASDAELEAPDDEANLAELDALFDDEPSTEAEDFSLFDEPSDAQLPQPTGEEPSGAALEPELNLDGQSADQEGSSATDLDAIDRDITDNTEPAADLSDLNLDDLDQELPEDLGFDVAAVDVTEDVWSEGDESWLDAIAEADPAPLTAAGAGGDAAPEAALPEEDALDEPLDSLFEALGDPPDIFATPDVEPGDGLSGVEGISVEEGDTGEISAEAIGFEESGPEAISAGEVGAEALDLEGPSDDDAESPFPELPAEEVVSEPPENSATPSPGPATQPFDDSILEDEPPLNALFSDFLGTDSEEAAANPDPFSLDDLVGDLHPDGDQPSQVTLDATPDPTAEQEDAAEISSAGETQLENWDEAPPSPEATGDEEALPGASEFDDLLSIGSRDLEDDSSDLADADVTDPIAALDAQQDPLSDLPDIGGGLQSSEPAFRSDSMADAFSDLDSLLGDTDAAVQADLLGDLESLEGQTGEGGDEIGLYDLGVAGGLEARQPDDPEYLGATADALEGDEAGLDPSIVGPNAEEMDDFADLEKLLEQADETLGGAPIPSTALRLSSSSRRPVRRPTLGNQTMRVSVKNLDNLNNLVGELVVNRNSLEQSQERLRQFLDNLMSQVQQLGDLGQRMRDLYERSLLESSLRSSRPQQAMPDIESDPEHVTGARFDALEMDRFTGFHSLSQEIIELIVRVREAASDIDFIVDESDQGTRMLRQITTQLQEGINHTRMVPFSQAADRLPRAVRDISIRFDKQAELVVEGRETLVDKMILEQLYDPMTHLVNNAITHGIETPDVRVAQGKSPVGRITVRAFHQGNQTIISVTDDGAGIDAEAVRQKALERGLITPDDADSMSKMDIYDLLFRHGFSTRDQADDFAGRGVGMDVVRTSLSEVRGAVNIDSALSRGTTFTIRLPLTLSISKALLCVSDRARIAFPMDGVEDMFDIGQERIQLNGDEQPCIPWRERLLPFRPLSSLLKFNRTISRGSVYGGSHDDDTISIVVLRSAGNYLALQVDQVLEEREIVIKQLEPPVPKPAGIAGATVLGDGRVMPIIDVLELVDLALGRWSTAIGDTDTEAAPPVDSRSLEEREPTVLIVDDSITVRELLSMTFAKVGYRVEQARDGQEAWEKLKSGLPCDLVFCDIEMPRMDGLELLSRLQRDPDLGDLPIAMLTSRGADRHRKMALDLGAKGYFTKPYLEEALLEAAQRILRGEVMLARD